MNTPLNITFQEISEERKLYVADSLNNLNKLKLCTNDTQDVLVESSEEGNFSVVLSQDSGKSRRIHPLLTVLIMTLVLTIILSSCVLYLLVHMNFTATEMSRKLERCDKLMEELEKLSNLVLFLNHSRVKEP
ncbi:Hypothetical predicted protein [Pelobates cultripes]|uniref:Leucine-rich single-pass membrane protein 1 n=1 Tax=Pelobates cultripes TaxID=61616 RepID=A0AAD1RTT9_PELCU|nr:Hypothetical predicted protein [Pelobates cultripes]